MLTIRLYLVIFAVILVLVLVLIILWTVAVSIVSITIGGLLRIFGIIDFIPILHEISSPSPPRI